MNRHAAEMDANAFWRQFVVAFYFENPGDVLTGTLTKYWADGPLDDRVPHIQVQTKEGRRYEVTVSQERLKVELVEAEPAVGDRLRITYDGEADKAAPGMNKAKLFTVEVRRAGSQPSERHPGESTGEALFGTGEAPRENDPGAGT